MSKTPLDDYLVAVGSGLTLIFLTALVVTFGLDSRSSLGIAVLGSAIPFLFVAWRTRSQNRESLAQENIKLENLDKVLDKMLILLESVLELLDTDYYQQDLSIRPQRMKLKNSLNRLETSSLTISDKEEIANFFKEFCHFVHGKNERDKLHMLALTFLRARKPDDYLPVKQIEDIMKGLILPEDFFSNPNIDNEIDLDDDNDEYGIQKQGRSQS